jgi:hypothetical protein
MLRIFGTPVGDGFSITLLGDKEDRLFSFEVDMIAKKGMLRFFFIKYRILILKICTEV